MKLGVGGKMLRQSSSIYYTLDDFLPLALYTQLSFWEGRRETGKEKEGNSQTS